MAAVNDRQSVLDSRRQNAAQKELTTEELNKSKLLRDEWAQRHEFLKQELEDLEPRIREICEGKYRYFHECSLQPTETSLET